MTIFNKEKSSVAPKELTSEDAQTIYDLLMDEGINPTRIFMKHGYSIRFIRQVIKEARRLEREAIAFCIANETVTVTSIKASLNSVLLNINIVGMDIIYFNPTYDAKRTFTEFREAYSYIAPIKEKIEE